MILFKATYTAFEVYMGIPGAQTVEVIGLIPREGINVQMYTLNAMQVDMD